VLLLGLALTLSPAGAGAAEPRGKGLVTVAAPADEGFARGDRVTVRIRLAPGAKLRSAELNNVGVRRYLRRAGPRLLRGKLDRRQLRALRRGRNFLRVVVRRGKSRDYRTVAFTLVRVTPRLVPSFSASYSRGAGLRVRLVASKPNTRIFARLNGRNVSAAFAAPRRRHRATLNAADGLRHGRNVVRVRVTHFGGQARYLRRAVVVPRGVTIAEAGPPVRQLLEEPARLDGAASRPVLRPDGKPATGGLRYRWSVVSGPRGGNPRLEGADGARPLLRADRPGLYRLRLATTMAAAEAGDEATTSVDTVSAQLGGQPLAPVNTMATAGTTAGISLQLTRECEDAQRASEEPCFYANPGGSDEVQMLVLERASLAPFEEEKEGKKVVVNRSYATSELAPLAQYLRKQMVIDPGGNGIPPEFASGKIVILSLRSGSVADKEGLAEALSFFNVDDEGQPAPLKGISGPFSMVGVPGTVEGRVAINSGSTEIVAADGSKLPAGAVAGVLKQVSDEAGSATSAETRAFAWPDALPYDTRAAEGAAFSLGNQSVKILPEGTAAGSDGIAVITFDPVNPGGSLQRSFVTNANGAGTDSGLDWKTLAEKLESAVTEQLGVALVSSGDIGQFITEPGATSFGSVLRQLELLGVNPDILARAVARNGTYSMVSAGERPGSSLPGEFRAGYSASSVLAEGVPEAGKQKLVEGRLVGTLKRASYGALYPTNGNPTGSASPANLGQILYQKQKPWLLTPAEGASAPGCQEVAFAYLAEQIAGIFEGSLPVLWTGADASACEAEETAEASGEAELREADSLVGDECAASEAVATGASGPAVREAAMTLRARYTGEAPLLPAEISSVTRPAGAPFTDADLACAKNQMIDEFNARAQVKKLVEDMEKPLTTTQSLGLIEIKAAAEEVEGALLAKIKGELEETSSSTGSFWASFALGLLSNVASMTVTYGGGPELFAGTAQLLEQSANVGGTLLPLAEGPEGNPVALTDQYIFLAEQLQRESTSAADRIENALQAQLGGIGQAGEILVSDPGKLAAASLQAKGAWDFDSEEIREAGQASVFRARQMTYQALWPTTYSGVRLSYKGYCQPYSSATKSQSCWNGSEWSAAPASLTHASQGGCYGVDSSFPQASSGAPGGLGAGNEYQPRTAPEALGIGPTAYMDYLMVETESIGGGKPKLAEPAVLAPFFAQPTAQEAKKEGAGQAAGFYPPEFWWQNIEMSEQIQCYDNGVNGNFQASDAGGVYEEIGANETWPTPPRSFCQKSSAGGSERATCTYDEGFLEEDSLDLKRLVEALGGDTETSGIWIGAYGGGGAHGSGGENGEGGEAGQGGFARTYASSATKLAERLRSTTLHYYLGEGGQQSGGELTGAGGASTVVASADISPGELGGGRERPCIASETGIEAGGQSVTIPRQAAMGGSCASAEQNVVLVAGGGGGGGHASSEADYNGVGKNGGDGGAAIATTLTGVAGGAQGSAHEKARRSHGGYNGEGGGKSKEGGGEAGGSGIGGYGGPAGAGGKTLWTNTSPFFGAESAGHGGEDGSGNGGHGGGGGGGFGGGGGGGAGGKSGAIPLGGSGGAGGGSYAYKGDEPPSTGVPAFARPQRAGSLIVVVDGVGATAVGVDATRSCRFRLKRLRAPTRAGIAYRNLSRDSAAAGCANARALATAAAKRPRKAAFRARGFRCRASRPIPARRAQQRRAAKARWICAYRARGRPGYAEVKFTLRFRR
jgi:hypothetical protein